MRERRSTPHSSRSVRVTNVISVGGCERARVTDFACAGSRAALDQLEFLAKFQAVPRQIDVEVGSGGIAVRARATLRGKVHAVLASEAQLEARCFLTQAEVDQGAHGSLKRLRRLAALKKEMEIAGDVASHFVFFFLGRDIDELAGIGEIGVERGVGQAIF